MDADPNGLIAMYLGSLGNRSARTFNTYEQHLRTLTSWCVENGRTVDACRRGDIARYLHALRSRGVTDRTISQYGNSARRFYEWAVRECHVAEDPTAGVVAKEVPSPGRQQYVSLGDMRRLVSACLLRPSDAAPVLLITLLGLDLQELVRIDVGDYRRTSAGATLTTRRAGIAMKHDLPPLLVSVLDELIGSRTRGLLLTNARSAPVTGASLGRVIDRVSQRAGVEPAPSVRDLAASARHVTIAEGFSFVEVVNAHSGRTITTLLHSVSSLPPPKRPASYRMAALLRPDQTSTVALLDQAHGLVFTDAHPAVRVMLAGAVLERHMRALAAEHQANDRPPSKPDGTGITTWTGPLTGAGVLTREESADCQFVADRRNEAAHGHFDLISDGTAEDVIARTERVVEAHPLSAVAVVNEAQQREPAPGPPVRSRAQTSAGDEHAQQRPQRVRRDGKGVEHE